MRIQHKLFLAMLGTSLLLVVSVVSLMLWSVNRGMLEYVNQRHELRGRAVAAELSDFYRAQGSWILLRQRPRLLYLIMVRGLDDLEPRPPQPVMRRSFQPLPDVLLMDSENRAIAGQLRAERAVRIPVISSNQVVGWLLVPQVKRIRTGFEEEFLARQRSTIFVIGGITLLLTTLLTLLLARHLLKPIRALAAGTNRLTQGDYSLNLPANRSDELGALARDFNQLAQTLAANDTSRKRWLADISHELRTPLAILRGEIEAMLDGVRPLNHGNLLSAQQEVQHLARLVDDLHALTLADLGGMQYRKQQCDVSELWSDVCAAHVGRLEAAGLRLTASWPQQELVILGDEQRLHQLLDNLLDNSRKYTDAGGAVRVSLRATANGVELVVEDSGPGVPDDALPRLFDHLYRVEHSRNRETGGSGLGLAICHQIAAGHQGTITATHSTLGGVRITVWLPDS